MIYLRIIKRCNIDNIRNIQLVPFNFYIFSKLNDLSCLRVVLIHLSGDRNAGKSNIKYKNTQLRYYIIEVNYQLDAGVIFYISMTMIVLQRQREYYIP